MIELVIVASAAVITFYTGYLFGLWVARENLDS